MVKDYTRHLEGFRAFAAERSLEMEAINNIEATIVKYFNHLYAVGEPAAKGEKTVVAWMFANRLRRIAAPKAQRSFLLHHAKIGRPSSALPHSFGVHIGSLM